MKTLAANTTGRVRVARVLLEAGPQTSTELAERLGVTPAAIRRHLDAMLEEGTVTARELPQRGARGRGRPPRQYSVTPAGRSLAGPQAYDDLAADALRFLALTGGAEAVEAFAQARVAELESRYEHAMTALPADATDAARVAALAEALTADGYAADSAQVGSGTTAVGQMLCQHHCPVHGVAAQFPQLCEAETAALGRLLGTHVQRLATIARGDTVCTLHVPGKSAGKSAGTPAVKKEIS